MTVTNTGTLSLTAANFSDALSQDGVAQGFTEADLTLVESGGTTTSVAGVLDVGESWTYTGSYTVDQGDLDDGNDLVNTEMIRFAQPPSQSRSATT